MSPPLTVTLTWIGTASPLMHAVVVDRGRGLVDAVGKLRHHVAALPLGLVEDLRRSPRACVSRPYLSNSSSSRRAAEAAGRHLRFHVAERGFRKADVVLDDAVERARRACPPRRS